MRKKFKGYYRPTTSEFKKIWEECIFIFDTNVLLNLYRYSNKTRLDLFKIFNKLSNRIWMPHQVALEFHKNRLEVINEQADSYIRLENSIDKFKVEIKENLESNRHPFIENTGEYLKKLDDLLNEIAKKLNEATKEFRGKDDEDKILIEITNLFEGKVGDCYKTEKLNAIYNEGKTRFENEVPPGFKDQKDKRGNNKYGDLILWNQIIDHAIEQNKSILLITDDQKEDWWWINKGKTISPRPELIQEIMDKAKCEFYMYRVEPFLQFAEKYLETSVDKNTYKEIKDVKKRILESSEKIKAANDLISRALLKDSIFRERLLKANLTEDRLKEINEFILRQNDIEKNLKHKFSKIVGSEEYLKMLSESSNNLLNKYLKIERNLNDDMNDSTK